MSGFSVARNLVAPTLRKAIQHNHVRCLSIRWPWTSPRKVIASNTLDIPEAEVQTMDLQFRYNVAAHGDKPCYGVRQVLRQWNEELPDGKTLKKLELADEYQWHSYREADAQVDRICRALHTVGLDDSTMVGMFAETRAEWLLASHACFRANIPIATAYTNLGPEGILRSFLKSKVKVIFTSSEELPKIKDLLPQLPSVTHVVYMPGPQHVENSMPSGGPTIMPLADFEKLGESVDSRDLRPPPGPNDLATVMFTSGSTGDPKGVRILHRNLANACLIYNKVLNLSVDRPAMAYLPMAHIMEMAVENLLLLKGVPIAFSSPFTLSGKSMALKEGQAGDMDLAEPAGMCAVPLILERIKKSILSNMEQRGVLLHSFFKMAMAYKTFCYHRDRETPILNWLLFRRIQANFGGNLQFVASGSAALCPETQLFLRVCLDIYLMSSFGATEVTSCAALQRLDDKSVGNCGAPLPGVEIKLENWEEGGYRVTDQPYPRGEVVVGGPTVADGYLGLNDNSFFKDDKGTQWFRTGDIGVILPTGQLNIIDRKKDLVKLQNGEFVSIAKVEGILRGCPEVENLCVVPHARQLVALVCPAEGVVGPEETKGRTFLPAPADLAGKLAQYCAEKGLSKVEIPTSFGLCLEEWTPESGLMTSALKIRRCPIKNRYLEKIESMLQ